MSATSAPLVTCIPISSPPPSPSPLAVSAPENMPVMPLNLQLARCTEPLPAMEQDDDAATSVIEYGSVATPEPTSDTPTGFVPNNIDGRHFYPIYVKNPKYSKWDLEPKMVVTEYIRYSIDYTEVTGTMGQGHKQRTTPVQVGRRACYYAAMTTAVTNLQGPPSERTPEQKLWDFKTRAQQYARDRESCDDVRISYLEFLETEAEDDLALARMIAG
jgi:hypothetical protein